MPSQYNLLDQWAQFLITTSLAPEIQFSTDDFAGLLANQTNLAIKGIVGIKAMSKVAEITGDTPTSSNYSVSPSTQFRTSRSSWTTDWSLNQVYRIRLRHRMANVGYSLE